MTDKEWEQFYMGDDGNFTFYLDLVKGQFAQNSFSPKRYDARPFRRVRGFKGTGEILQDGQIIPVVFVMTGERRKTRYVLPVVSVYVPQEGE